MHGTRKCQYGDASHLLNLVGQAATPAAVMAHVTHIHKYYRNHHNAGAWLAQKEGTIRPQLPADTRWNSQVDTLKAFIRNRPAYIAISAEHDDDIDDSVTQKVNSLALYRNAQDLVAQLEPIAVGIDRLQSDKACLADTVDVWLGLLEDEKLEPHRRELERRLDQAVTDAHLAAYLVHPRYMGAKLSLQQYDRAMAHFPEDLHPVIVQMHGEQSPFPKAFFSAPMKMLHPTEWWGGVSKRPGVNPKLAEEALALLSKPPSSASIERTFSSFGFIQSKLRNRLGHDTASKLVFAYGILRGREAAED